MMLGRVLLSLSRRVISCNQSNGYCTLPTSEFVFREGSSYPKESSPYTSQSPLESFARKREGTIADLSLLYEPDANLTTRETIGTSCQSHTGLPGSAVPTMLDQPSSRVFPQPPRTVLPTTSIEPTKIVVKAIVDFPFFGCHFSPEASNSRPPFTGPFCSPTLVPLPASGLQRWLSMSASGATWTQSRRMQSMLSAL